MKYFFNWFFIVLILGLLPLGCDEGEKGEEDAGRDSLSDADTDIDGFDVEFFDGFIRDLMRKAAISIHLYGFTVIFTDGWVRYWS